MTDLIVEIREDLKSQVHNFDVISKRFIVAEDIGRIYNDKLPQLFRSPEWQKEDIKLIQTSYLKVLSILILAGWPEVCGGDITCFRTSFFNHPTPRADEDLPFDKDSLELRDHLKFGFCEWQYAFCPVVIKEYECSQSPDDHFQTVDSTKRRLPLKEENCALGQGASGRVEQVTIPHYCHHKYSESKAPYVNDEVLC